VCGPTRPSASSNRSNAELAQKPETVNQEPYGGGWMIVVTPADAKEWDQLLTAAQYEQFIAEGGH
jgi:glycine cleavage system H protein